VSAFKDATSAANVGSRVVHFNAGAITWGTTPDYLTVPSSGGRGTTLGPTNNDDLERAFAAAKSLEPSGVTYYGAPFTWFEHELLSRGAA
jgi:hypothetical protein